MNAGNLWFFLKILPLLAFTAVIFGFFGWWLRRKFQAPVVSSSKTATPEDLPARERVKKLEHALAKSETAQKALKLELETLQAKSVGKAALDKTAKELAEAQHRLESDQKRIATLETELKKARDAVNSLNSKNAEANKGQRERTFALENELSKARGELATLNSRPDNSLTLQAEVDRLRESLVNSTRVVGELRKQEAAAVQALDKAQKQLEAALAKNAPTPSGGVSLLPALEQAFPPAVDRTAEAKADLERIQALNARQDTERLTAEKAAAEKAAAEKAAAEKAAAEKAAAEKAAAEKAAAEKAAADKAAAEQAAAEQAAAEQAAAEQAAAEKAAAEKAAAEQAAAEQAPSPAPVAPAIQADLFAEPNPASAADADRPVA